MSDTNFLAELLSASGEAAYAWDLEADHIQWFGAWNRIFGNQQKPPSNSREFYDILHEDDRHIVFGAEAHNIDREFRLRHPDGRYIPVHEYGVAEFKDERLVRQNGILRVMDEHAGNFGAHEWSGRDELTGCFDRSRLLAQIQKSLDAARDHKRSCAYMVLGIDKMSFVNEAVGMEAGDGLLRSVAQRLTEILPPRAYLGRVGGDMFGILLIDPLARDFPLLAERILQTFRHQPVVTSVVPIHITVSIGAVRLPMIAHTPAEAMIFAEQALHDARQKGRNLFVEYIDSPERAQMNRESLVLSERVKHAFKHDGLRLAFQPIVDIKTFKPVYYEALVRIFSDDGQIIPAAKFVPVIERLGLAGDLDRHVLDLAVRELEEFPDLRLAVNVSGLTAAQADWPDHVRRVLGSRRSVAERMTIEITETAAIVDVSETRRFADTVRDLGGEVALDDFGAGFTSIRHLRSLALSTMKIDRDLLNDILNHPEQQHLVRMLIEIARGLKLKTVAEGIETLEVAQWLQGEKVDMLQGYYFGKPTLDRPWLAKDGEQGKAATTEAQCKTADSKESTVIRVASY